MTHTFTTTYQGKTKNVLRDHDTGDTYLQYKDDATGTDGVFDPGSNTVGGSVAGKGKVGLAISSYFFELLEARGIPTHFLGADLDAGLMQVRPVTVPPLEFVLRYYTAGSICRRFDLQPNLPFDPPYTEVMLKSDEQGDPLISERLCIMKGYLQPGEFDQALDLLCRVGEVLRAQLAGFDLKLLDFKIELGFDEQRNIVLADEITPDIWRVQDSNGIVPDQIDCARLVLEHISAT
ncbi:MAG: phosphoribosylaminoimidazolesuccinocarboxamide synthase [Coriobacteriia bacterium]|nr:phosphoribosylaminoimidazolesuccinocarboxamide synthase [Coriobacteriia bacterium]